jgi:hypothetical protein
MLSAFHARKKHDKQYFLPMESHLRISLKYRHLFLELNHWKSLRWNKSRHSNKPFIWIFRNKSKNYKKNIIVKFSEYIDYNWRPDVAENNFREIYIEDFRFYSQNFIEKIITLGIEKKFMSRDQDWKLIPF